MSPCFLLLRVVAAPSNTCCLHVAWAGFPVLCCTPLFPMPTPPTLSLRLEGAPHPTYQRCASATEPPPAHPHSPKLAARAGTGHQHRVADPRRGIKSCLLSPQDAASPLQSQLAGVLGEAGEPWGCQGSAGTSALQHSIPGCSLGGRRSDVLGEAGMNCFSSPEPQGAVEGGGGERATAHQFPPRCP